MSLASLARNLEICLVSRKTSKMQEIAHYSQDSGCKVILTANYNKKNFTIYILVGGGNSFKNCVGIGFEISLTLIC